MGLFRKIFERAREQVVDDPDTSGVAFITVAGDLDPGIEGQHYFFEFQWTGSHVYLTVEGYPRVFHVQGRSIYIPACVPGSYTLLAQLCVDAGSHLDQVVDTLEIPWTVLALTDLSNAVINTVNPLPAINYRGAATISLDVSGSGPFKLRLKAGALPEGVSLRYGYLTRNELAQSFIEGSATREGAGTSFGISIEGANAVESSTYTFASGIPVNRAPGFEGFSSIPVLPTNTPGAVDLAPFIRAYPAIDEMTISPALSTFSANLAISGLTFTYGDLTAVNGQTSGDFVLTLESNGVGTPENKTISFTVDAVPPPPPTGVISRHSTLTVPATTTNALVPYLDDVAQGNAIRLHAISSDANSESGRWLGDGASQGIYMRTGNPYSLMGIEGLNIGAPPYSLDLRWKPKSDTSAGDRLIWSAGDMKVYLNLGATGGGAATYLSSVATEYTGSRTSNTRTYTPASAIAGVLVIVQTVTATDLVSSVVLDGASPITVPLVTSAHNTVGADLRTYYHFLGSGIPAGTLSVKATYSGSTTTSTHITVIGLTASTDLEIVGTATPETGTQSNSAITVPANSRDSIAIMSLFTGLANVSDITSGGSQTRIAGYEHTSNTYAGVIDYQTTHSSTDFNASWTNASDNVAICGVKIGEVQGSGTKIGFKKGTGNIAYTPTMAATLTTNAWHSTIFEVITADTAKITNDGTSYDISGTAIAGDLSEMRLGGSGMANFDFRGCQQFRGAHDASSRAAAKTWLDAQDSGTPPPPPPPPAGSITKDWAGWTQPGAVQCNADMTFQQHDGARIRLTCGNASSPNLHNRNITLPDATGDFRIGNVIALQRVDRTVTYLGATRKAFNWRLWSTMPLWSGNDSIRLHADAIVYQAYTYGVTGWWSLFRFEIDDTYQYLNGVNSNVAFADHHELAADYPGVASIKSTQFTAGLNPQNGGGTGTIFYRNIRGHSTVHATFREDTATQLVSGATTPQFKVVAGKVYDVVMYVRAHPWDSGDSLLQIWAAEDGVLLNSGNPFVNYTGRFGYNVGPTETDGLANPRMNRRPLGQGLYITRGTFHFTNIPADNKAWVPSGAKGVEMWCFKSATCPDGTYGGIKMNLNEALAYLRRDES